MKKYKGESKSKEEAKLRAKELADYLKKELGGNWKPRVWNNIGWYYNVHLGSMSVSFHFNKYSCLISDGVNGGGGMGYWSKSFCSFPNPKKAVEFAMKNANEFVKKVTDIMQKNKDLISKKGLK
ncbi:MAG: hypothetical protein IPJ01_10415 [Micavibrio sp.]|nr:hypothetical protein [Micavibrio sp.]